MDLGHKYKILCVLRNEYRIHVMWWRTRWSNHNQNEYMYKDMSKMWTKPQLNVCLNFFVQLNNKNLNAGFGYVVIFLC